MAGGLAFSASADTIEPAGWLTGEAADEAIEKATEHNVPIAIMRTFRDPNCPKCVAAANRMSASKSTKKMVRVLVYTDADASYKSDAASALLSKQYRQTKDKSNYIPDLYFLMPDGRALGFVPYEDAGNTESEAKAVSQIGAWINGMDDALAKIDRDAEKGRYASALKDLAELEAQDAKINHMVRVQLGLVDADEEMPETPESLFFPGLKDEKVAEYKALAMTKIAEVEALIEEGELRDAQRLLRTLSRTPEDFEAHAKAKELTEKVKELLKAS